MAHVSDIRTGASNLGASSFFARIHGMRDTMSKSISQYRSYRVTLGELQNLTQRELDDMGIHRENIRDIALKASMK